MSLAAKQSITPAQAAPVLAAVESSPLSHSVRIEEVARRQHVPLAALMRAAGVGASFSADGLASAELELKYAGFFERERMLAARLKQLGELALDADLPYEEMRSLATEARQKLARIRPRTLAQAGRISGVTPSDLQNLALEVARRDSAAAGDGMLRE